MADGLQVQAGFADLNGARFYYEVAGAGHPLILLHAGIADGQMWDGQFHAFAQDYKIVRYDARGYGRTPMVAGPFAHYKDLRGLLKYLGIARASLLGCSMGGATSIDFALEHPEMVDALILVGSGLSGYAYAGEAPLIWDAMVAARRAGDLARAAELRVQIWVDGPRRTPDQVDPAVRDRVREMSMIPLATPDGLGTEQKPQPPASGRLSELRVPALIIYGEMDQPAILEIADLLATEIGGARKVVMPGVAHVPSMERPAEFNQLVLDFLRTLQGHERAARP